MFSDYDAEDDEDDADYLCSYDQENSSPKQQGNYRSSNKQNNLGQSPYITKKAPKMIGKKKSKSKPSRQIGKLGLSIDIPDDQEVDKTFKRRYI